MFVAIVGVTLVIGLVVSQYEYSMSRDMPMYVERALRRKSEYKLLPREKKRTISNLTMREVLDKIRDITGALNRNAKMNGYFVDYKLKLLKT